MTVKPVNAQISGDHFWYIRVNADDRFHSNEAWLKPWRYSYDDGVGKWVGGYSYDVPWYYGPYKQGSGSVGSLSWSIDSNGNLRVSAPQDYQWHAWTYVYVDSPKNLSIPGGGDCVPAAFVNYAFNTRIYLPGTLNLTAGWNRIDITGYNQNDSYSFNLNYALANNVNIMNSSQVNMPPELNPIGNKLINEGVLLQYTVTGHDMDGNALTYSAGNLPPGASFNPTTHMFSWTPGFNQSGNYPNVLFTVTDNGTPSLSDSETITITVSEVNCDGSNPNSFPGAPELCDGEDNDCDGVIPANEADSDNDGFRLCDNDCDDGNSNTHPGATEICDGEDNDCDNQMDEGGDALCDDDIFCNGAEICDGTNGCQPGAALNCPDTNPNNPCDAGSCNVNLDLCEQVAANVGTECRSSAGDCDVAEVCDGVSTVCPADGYEPAGTACGDPTDNACTNPDACDGNGVCQDNHEPAGTVCGDPTDDVCTNPDSCNGDGTCLDNHEPGATVCRASVGTCDIAESCDGVGNCPADAFEPDNTLCNDALFCTNNDICQGGVCSGSQCDTCQPPNVSVEAVIGPNGGILATPDGIVTLSIPANALAVDTNITISNNGQGALYELTTNLGAGVGVYGFNLSPAGQTFNVPVTITYRWTADAGGEGVGCTNFKEKNVRIVQDNVVITNQCKNEPGPLTDTDAECDQAANTFSVRVTNFSDFALVVLYADIPNNNCDGIVYPVLFDDFDIDTGNWVNIVNGDDLDWTLMSDSTPSSGTGPSCDHTSCSGQYLYVEASDPNYPNKSAYLESGDIDLSPFSNPYIEFWYHMYGDSMGSLVVDVYFDGQWYNEVWSVSGDQGNDWHNQLIDLSSYAGIIKIRFRGITGTRYRSDISIDDVRVAEYEVCDNMDNNCDGQIDEGCVDCTDVDEDGYIACEGDCNDYDPNVNPGAKEICDGIDNDCDGVVDSSISDDFEENLMGNWINIGNDDLLWIRKKGSTPSSGTGPSCDHSSCNGYYLYVEASAPNFPDKTAVLESTIDLRLFSNPQLEFWRYLYGAYMGSLQVDIYTDGQWNNGIWSLSGNQGNSWQYQVIDLSSYKGIIKIRFRGITGDDYRSDIAIDDINISEHDVCDGIDNNCDGQIDEGCSNCIDNDNDGFAAIESVNCSAGPIDCDDSDPNTYPGAPELCDGKDNDCDGVIPANEIDSDDDGYKACDGDCDDNNSDFYPGAPELCDGKDNNCDGVIPTNEIDSDGDGYKVCDGDCDDNNSDFYPGAPELCDGQVNDCICNGPENACIALVPANELDSDNDGYRLCDSDCDDSDSNTYPGAPELCDGKDNDCDGVTPANETDSDNDGYRVCDSDCDDNDSDTYPGAPELCDGNDNDCDGVIPINEGELPVICILRNTIDVINDLDPVVFRNEYLKNALTDKITEIINDINQGLYVDALNKLKNDVLGKINGCSNIGAPDKNDWIVDCDIQRELLYLVLIQVIDLLSMLL